MVPPLITLEEHYVSSEIRSHLGANDHYKNFPPAIVEKLTDLSTNRIKDMDNNAITMQILSHGPLDAPLDPCRKANDALAAAVSKNATRLAAFAMLPMSAPADAASELERCVTAHKFVGALINNHVGGQFYDSEKFWPVFEKAVELDVPIYIHPTFAPEGPIRERYSGNFSERAAFLMSSAAWAWHADTGLHVLRLWASGLFDRFPALKVVIGHMGEMIPFQLERIVGMSKGMAPNRKRDLRTVWRENFWITTSGMFTAPPLKCLLASTCVDRVLFSIDYPFSGNEKGLEFVRELENGDVVGKEDLEKICYRNAEALLKVKVQH